MWDILFTFKYPDGLGRIHLLGGLYQEFISNHYWQLNSLSGLKGLLPVEKINILAMKNLLFCGLVYLTCINYARTQIECIQCFPRTAPISPEAVNLIRNGGFEDHNCIPSWFQGSYCPSSDLYNCDIDSWRCIGGGTNSYPIIFDSTLSLIP